MLSASLLVLVPSTANAHYFGGKFPHSNGSWLYLGWTHSSPVAYATSEIDFYGYAYNVTWWGYSESASRVWWLRRLRHRHRPCSGGLSRGWAGDLTAEDRWIEA